MGYTSEFHGEIDIDPPLNGAEIAFLTAFAEERHEDDPAAPGIWCQWVPGPFSSGASLAWDRGEKFYNAAEWMAYLIDHFLKPGASAQGAADELDRFGRVVGQRPDPLDEFEAFGFNHVLNGVIEVQGEDSDDRWVLTVKDNEVFTQDVNLNVMSGTPQRVV